MLPRDSERQPGLTQVIRRREVRTGVASSLLAQGERHVYSPRTLQPWPSRRPTAGRGWTSGLSLSDPGCLQARGSLANAGAVMGTSPQAPIAVA